MPLRLVGPARRAGRTVGSHVPPSPVGSRVPPSLLMIGNNYLKQLAFDARANSPAPICRSSNYHDSECSRCARRTMLFLKVVMVVSKSQVRMGEKRKCAHRPPTADKGRLFTPLSFVLSPLSSSRTNCSPCCRRPRRPLPKSGGSSRGAAQGPCGRRVPDQPSPRRESCAREPSPSPPTRS